MTNQIANLISGIALFVVFLLVGWLEKQRKSDSQRRQEGSDEP